ncbi:histidine phosphatase family protein [Sulfitobacter albidus]|uniref:Histidine phosphatase family protein n=1 Tax=Sulfitobacter albidus TaxID=2829501 RepID=A0A975JEB3_9RHOB|nr:histidine phosphatase family protein [Sulfitobacter albidus]QUJ76676.1 histidine phosphatase family protein [Sulfitobacter albidus]
MIRLALLRHGHTAWNRAGRVQGRSDIPLDAVARADLSRLRIPAPWTDTDLVSSPLSRAVETAMLVAGRAPRPVAALTEMNWGDWEGREAAALRADPACDHRDIEDWSWHYRPPGGESPAEVRARVLAWRDALTRDTLAVCHIGVMRVLLADGTGWDFSGPAPFAVKRNRLFVLERTAAGWRHLPDTPRLEDRPE